METVEQAKARWREMDVAGRLAASIAGTPESLADDRLWEARWQGLYEIALSKKRPASCVDAMGDVASAWPDVAVISLRTGVADTPAFSRCGLSRVLGRLDAAMEAIQEAAGCYADANQHGHGIGMLDQARRELGRVSAALDRLWHATEDATAGADEESREDQGEASRCEMYRSRIDCHLMEASLGQLRALAGYMDAFPPPVMFGGGASDCADESAQRKDQGTAGSEGGQSAGTEAR